MLIFLRMPSKRSHRQEDQLPRPCDQLLREEEEKELCSSKKNVKNKTEVKKMCMSSSGGSDLRKDLDLFDSQ